MLAGIQLHGAPFRKQLDGGDIRDMLSIRPIPENNTIMSARTDPPVVIAVYKDDDWCGHETMERALQFHEVRSLRVAGPDQHRAIVHRFPVIHASPEENLLFADRVLFAGGASRCGRARRCEKYPEHPQQQSRALEHSMMSDPSHDGGHT